MKIDPMTPKQDSAHKKTVASKVTKSMQIAGFIREHKAISEKGFKNTRGEVKIWWDGYNSAIQQLEQRFPQSK